MAKTLTTTAGKQSYAYAAQSRIGVWYLATPKWSMNMGIGDRGRQEAERWAGLLNEAHADGIGRGISAEALKELRKRLDRMGILKKIKQAS